MKEDFLSLLDGNLEQMGFSDRANFIREAVYEKLRANKVDVDKILSIAPSRAGKGGRPKTIRRMNLPEDSAMVADDGIPHVPKPTTKPTPHKKPATKKREKQG